MLSPYLYLALYTLVLLRAWEHGKNLLHDYGERARFEASEARRVALYLVILAASSLYTVLYLARSGVNPNSLVPGVDAQTYLESVLMVKQDPSKVFTVAGGERPFLFFLIYVFQRMFGVDAFNVLRYFPLVLNPLLVSSTFLFARELSGSDDVGLWVSYFTVFGFKLSVAHYSLYIANVLGLSLMMLSLACLFKAVNGPSRRLLAAAVVLNGLALFSHPWTFDHVMVPLTATALMVLYLELRVGSFQRVQVYGVYLASSLVFELLKAYVLGMYGATAAMGTFLSKLTTLQDYTLHLQIATRYIYGGFYANVVFISLAFLGVILIGCRDDRDLFLWSFLTLSSLGFLTGNDEIKSRIIFNTPLCILAAYSVYRYSKTADDSMVRLALISLTLYLGTRLFGSLANIV